MNPEKDKLDDLIAGGLIGAGLGALLARDKEDGAIIGALLGAAFTATLRANKEAHKTNQPVYEAVQGRLYRMMPNGEREFIKELPKASKKWSGAFMLK